MAIISAGVFMNVVFAFLVATIAYAMGVYKIDSELGMIAPGGPAWKADLRAGDRVIEVAGTPIAEFDKLQQATVFGSLEDGLSIVVRASPASKHRSRSLPTRTAISECRPLEFAAHQQPDWPTTR